jgi:hypothetical protein
VRTVGYEALRALTHPMVKPERIAIKKKRVAEPPATKVNACW